MLGVHCVIQLKPCLEGRLSSKSDVSVRPPVKVHRKLYLKPHTQCLVLILVGPA